jgi:sulfite reductase (NADPH) hemoprotein beta-component
VARIAHLASDVIVSVVPSLATESEFSETLRSLQKNNAASIVAKGQTEVCEIRLSTLNFGS